MLLYVVLEKRRKVAQRAENPVLFPNVKGSFRLNTYEQNALLNNWLIAGLRTFGRLYVTRLNSRDTNHAEKEYQNYVYES
jgi:hypothetical protein